MSTPSPKASTQPQVPPYRLLFPAGWTRHDVTEESERALLERSRAQFKQYGRPDLDFQMTARVKASFRQLRTQNAFALFMMTEAPDNGVIPFSITAAYLRDPHGRSLDTRIAQIFREEGGEFLGDDRTIVRWTRSYRGLPDLPGAVNEQINYAIPVPGTERRLALLFSSSILNDDAATVDDPTREMLVTLSDAIMGTFTWATK